MSDKSGHVLPVGGVRRKVEAFPGLTHSKHDIYNRRYVEMRVLNPKPLFVSRERHHTVPLRRMSTWKPKKSSTNLTIAGFEKFSSQEKSIWLRGIWLCVIFLFYGLCVFQLSDRVGTYLEGPIITQSELSTEMSIKFPSVTVCPTTVFTFIGRIMCSYSSIFENETFTYDEETDLWESCNFTHSNFTLEKAWKMFRINNASLTITTECMKEGKERRCKTVLKPKMKSIATFFGTCLAITFEKTSIAYPGSMTNMKHHITNVVFVPHAADVIPRHPVTLFMETVFEGYQVYAEFIMTKFIHLNTKKNPCVAEQEAKACETDCLNKYVDENAECRLPFMANRSKPQCQTFLDFFYAVYDVNVIYSEYEGCNCSRPCEETVINFKSDNFKSRDNTTLFNLRCLSNSIETITEKYSYTLSALISDIGGNFGFCVGLCLFSFVEIIECAIIKGYLWIKKSVLSLQK